METRLSAMDALGRKRAGDTQNGLPWVAGERKRVYGLHLAFALNKEVAKERSQQRNPSSKDKWGAATCPPQDGLEAAVPEWTA